MSQYALQMLQISKTYGTIRANDSITFSVPSGTIHALAGENGAGKSTLMKILFGLEQPDSTSEDSGIFIDEKKVNFTSPLDAIHSGIGMVQQHFAIAGALSAIDNIILGNEPTKNFLVDRFKAEEILKKMAGAELGVKWLSPADGLSVGMQQRLEILKLLFRKAQILILDEPTAVLTPQEVEGFFQLLKRLRSEGRTIILITHKLNEVLSLCDNVTILRQGKVTGTFSTHGLTKENLIRAMIGRDLKPTVKTPVTVGSPLVEVNNLSTQKTNHGCLQNLSFKIHSGEIVGIAGVEGNGQQDLVESLLGIAKYDGEILYDKNRLQHDTHHCRENLNFGLISEDRHNQSLWLDQSVEQNMIIGSLKKFSKFGILLPKKITAHAKESLTPYDVKMSSVKSSVSSLSGGNQQKIVVAREVSVRKPKFLVASQPTRGVDVGAIEFIHAQLLALQKSGSGILLISSELEELCALSDRILVLYDGKIAEEFQRLEFDVNKIGRAMTEGGSS